MRAAIRNFAWAVLVFVVPLTVLAVEPLTPIELSRFREIDAKRLHQMTNAELSDFLPLKARALEEHEIAQGIKTFAEKGIQQPYRLASVRFDLGESDCVTYVETVLATALSSDWASYYRLRQRLSHKDGVAHLLERNHFTLADWIPNNRWLLNDITASLGTPVTEFSYTVKRKEFFSKLYFGEDEPVTGPPKAAAKAAKIASVPETETHQDRYILKESMPDVLGQLQTGDVCLIIGRPNAQRAWPDCEHMGLISVASDGTVSLIHNAPPRARQEELREFLGHYKRIAGLKFLRLRPNPRAIVAAELAGPAANISVTPPAEEDAKNVELRALRAH